MASKEIRPIRVEGQLAYVALTRGHVAVIDLADVPLVQGFNWTAILRKHTVYAARVEWRGQVQRKIYMHRLLTVAPSGLDVDHADGDGLNNRRANLRLATKSQNICNQRVRSDNRSGLKGVSLNARGKWQANIAKGGRQRFLGAFATPEEAHAAYCAASAEIHKEFGRTA
jgi:hypothetical protein